MGNAASVVIAYLMLELNMPYEKAFYMIKGLKSSINPSVTLKKFLSAYSLTLSNLKS